MAAKLDFRREFPDYYRQDPQPHLERFGVVPYLAFEGKGQPGGEEFQAGVQALFAVAYGAKFGAKAKGHDFTVPALEALWWVDGQRPTKAAGTWSWKLLLRMPATFTKDQLEAAKAAAVGRAAWPWPRRPIWSGWTRATACRPSTSVPTRVRLPP